jgi:ribosomal protein L32
MKTILVLPLLFTTIVAISIECDFEMKIIFNTFSSMYTCCVKTVVLTDGKSLETVTGTHEKGKTNADVKQLSFGWPLENCQNLDFVPQNIHKHFPNIIGIFFAKSCNFRALTGEELIDLPNLEWFSIKHNLIDKIPGSLFQSNRKLKAVDFGNNKITKVGPNLFNGLEDMTHILFNHNVCLKNGYAQNKDEVAQYVQKLKEMCPFEEDASCLATNIPHRTCQLEETVANQQKIIAELIEENKAQKIACKNVEDRLTKLEVKLLY